MKFSVFFIVLFFNNCFANNYFEDSNPFSKSSVYSRIIGDIDLIDGPEEFRHPVFFNGKSCYTDKNSSCYSFACDNHKINEPVFLLITTGNYSASRKEVFGDKTFPLEIIKQDPQKKYYFYILRFDQDDLFFEQDNNFLKDCAYEIPSDKTILLNISPSWVPEGASFRRKRINVDQGILHLPTIKVLVKKPLKAETRSIKKMCRHHRVQQVNQRKLTPKKGVVIMTISKN